MISYSAVACLVSKTTGYSWPLYIRWITCQTSFTTLPFRPCPTTTMLSISASSPPPPPLSLDRLSEEESLRIFLVEVDLWLSEIGECIAALETRHKKNLSMDVGWVLPERLSVRLYMICLGRLPKRMQKKTERIRKGGENFLEQHPKLFRTNFSSNTIPSMNSYFQCAFPHLRVASTYRCSHQEIRT